MKNLFKCKTIKFLLFFLLLIPFVGCREDEDEITYYDTYIYGYVTDNNTGAPVSGISFDIYYNYGSSSDWSQGDLFVRNAVKTDSRGYYKVQIPKTIKNKKVWCVDFSPNETEAYGFQRGEFFIKDDFLSIRSKRVDITPISYGYLKVIVPKKDSIRLFTYTGSYQKPFKEPKYLGADTIGDVIQFLYRVPATSGTIRHLVNHYTDGPEYNFEVYMPKDTVVINLLKK